MLAPPEPLTAHPATFGLMVNLMPANGCVSVRV
jgi:hypothetical protein